MVEFCKATFKVLQLASCLSGFSTLYFPSSDPTVTVIADSQDRQNSIASNYCSTYLRSTNSTLSQLRFIVSFQQLVNILLHFTFRLMTTVARFSRLISYRLVCAHWTCRVVLLNHTTGLQPLRSVSHIILVS